MLTEQPHRHLSRDAQRLLDRYPAPYSFAPIPSPDEAVLDALEAAHKRIAELEAELDAARRWYRL